MNHSYFRLWLKDCFYPFIQLNDITVESRKYCCDCERCVGSSGSALPSKASKDCLTGPNETAGSRSLQRKEEKKMMMIHLRQTFPLPARFQSKAAFRPLGRPGSECSNGALSTALFLGRPPTQSHTLLLRPLSVPKCEKFYYSILFYVCLLPQESIFDSLVFLPRLKSCRKNSVESCVLKV